MNRKAITIIIVAFFALGFLIYGHALGSDFILWDDDLLVFENPMVMAFNFKTIWQAFSMYDPELYIPLTFVSYQINHLIGGISPFIYHLTNLILHIGSALFFAGSAYFLSKKNLFIGVLTGILFLIHPLNTEAVMWVSARKDVLSIFFMAASLLSYLQFCDSNKAKHYWASVLFFALGLLSKVMVITLPALLLLIDWYREGKISRARIQEKIPYFALSLIFAIVAIAGKSGQVGATFSLEMILMACKSIVFYIQKLIAPINLSIIYPYTNEIGLRNPDILISIAITIALVGIALYSLRKSRIGLFALLFFLAAAAPTFFLYRKGLNGLDVYFATNRYIYPSTFAFFFLVAAVISAIPIKIRNIAAGIMVIACSLLAFQESKLWKDSETLFTHALELYPEAQAAHNNLATVYYQQGKLAEAEQHYREALSIRMLPDTLSNLASLYRRTGNLDEALVFYEEALKLNPNEVQAHLGLGLLYAQANQLANAEAAYQKALEINPANEKVYLNLGGLYLQMGRLDDAVESFDKAIVLHPYYASAYFNLGNAYQRLGRTREAEEAKRRAIELNPELSR